MPEKRRRLMNRRLVRNGSKEAQRSHEIIFPSHLFRCSPTQQQSRVVSSGRGWIPGKDARDQIGDQLRGILDICLS
jgi:hypothetical protein